MFTRALASIAGLFLVAQAFAGTPTPETRYAEALAALDAKCDQFCGYGINDSPEERTALDALWDATQDWTVAYLNAHPKTGLHRLNIALFNRHSHDRTNVAPNTIVELEPGLYGVLASWEWTGNVFLVEKRDTGFVVAWDIRKADPGAFPVLQAWRTENAHNDCEPGGLANHDNCGPIIGDEIKLLPSDSQGHLRFALMATYGQLTETTIGGQLSIWTLDGDTPRIQWAKPYLYNFEDVSWRFRGDQVIIRATDWWHTLFACGTCIGRQMDWTLRIRPDGIDDLGMTPRVPELDAFDELAYRIFKGKNTDDLAVPEVRARLAALVNALKAQDEELAKAAKDTSSDPNLFFFGMFDYKVRKMTDGTELSLNTDDLEQLGVNSIRIRFTRRDGRLYAVDLTQIPEQVTEKPVKSPP